MFTGLHIDPSGHIGISEGEFHRNDQRQRLSMNGGLYPIQMGTDTISPEDFYNSIITGSLRLAAQEAPQPPEPLIQ